MNKNKDWGPAFPNPLSGHPKLDPDQWLQGQIGMSLRDWFAGQALSGDMSRDYDPTPEWQKKMAWRAYSVADAMLAEKDKTP